jgi:pSer/pThr/pTyr-binding forkhead associated (FHA) protein
MARLVLKFADAALKEIPIGSRPITIGRAPDNDISIDNLAVSNYHARVYAEADRLVVEDLNSLNGTFVNDLRIERAALRDGDAILIGKHHIVVDEKHDAALPLDAGRKVAAPKVDETMVLDTRERREMLQQAVAAGERSPLAHTRVRVPSLSVVSGRTDQREYLLSSKLTVIGKSEMATVRLRGWFAPRVAAQINKRDDGYYLGRADRVPKINGQPIAGPTRLNDGDLIEVGGVRLTFLYRE